jgi:hypothetical protein
MTEDQMTATLTLQGWVPSMQEDAWICSNGREYYWFTRSVAVEYGSWSGPVPRILGPSMGISDGHEVPWENLPRLPALFSIINGYM